MLLNFLDGHADDASSHIRFTIFKLKAYWKAIGRIFIIWEMKFCESFIFFYFTQTRMNLSHHLVGKIFRLGNYTRLLLFILSIDKSIESIECHQCEFAVERMRRMRLTLNKSCASISVLRIWEIVKSVNESEMEFFECFSWQTRFCVWGTHFTNIPMAVGCCNCCIFFLFAFKSNTTQHLFTHIKLSVCSHNTKIFYPIDVCDFYLAHVIQPEVGENV